MKNQVETHRVRICPYRNWTLLGRRRLTFAIRARLSIRDDGVTITTHTKLDGTLLADFDGELYLVRRKEA